MFKNYTNGHLPTHLIMDTEQEALDLINDFHKTQYETLSTKVLELQKVLLECEKIELECFSADGICDIMNHNCGPEQSNNLTALLSEAELAVNGSESTEPTGG